MDGILWLADQTGLSMRALAAEREHLLAENARLREELEKSRSEPT